MERQSDWGPTNPEFNQYQNQMRMGHDIHRMAYGSTTQANVWGVFLILNRIIRWYARPARNRTIRVLKWMTPVWIMVFLLAWHWAFPNS
jgi:hypothetical protein